MSKLLLCTNLLLGTLSLGLTGCQAATSTAHGSLSSQVAVSKKAPVTRTNVAHTKPTATPAITRAAVAAIVLGQAKESQLIAKFGQPSKRTTKTVAGHIQLTDEWRTDASKHPLPLVLTVEFIDGQSSMKTYFQRTGSVGRPDSTSYQTIGRGYSVADTIRTLGEPDTATWIRVTEKVSKQNLGYFVNGHNRSNAVNYHFENDRLIETNA